MSTSVKHIHSGMRGAPTLNGTAGTLIAVLDAFFTTGWGVTTAVSVSVASGIATATLTAGQSFDRDSVVLVDGATPSGLNGEARVLSSTNTSITWATAAADGAATGTITIRYAPQTSWEKVYAGTNKAVYRSADVLGHRHYLRVDDTGTTTARVRGFETMTDVDTGTGPFPTDVQMSGGGYWWKSVGANATAVAYRLFSDERCLITSIVAGRVTGSSYYNGPARIFGDPLELAPSGDPWSTLLSVTGSSNGNATTGAVDSSGASSAGSGLTCAPKGISALGGSVLLDSRAYTGSNNGTSGSDSYLGNLPSEVDGRVMLTRMMLRQQGTEKPPRVIVPGLYYIPQGGAVGVLNDGDTILGSGEVAGRRLMCVATGGFNTTTVAGVYLMDITGPWR
jgi:hypothetical protein